LILRQTILILLFLLGFSALCGLGVWQLQRAELKAERHALFVDRFKSARIGLSKLLNASDVIWRPVTLDGKYLDINVLLDNRVLNTRAGYEVFSLFEIKEYGTVLVSRGWTSNQGDRSILPQLPLPQGEVELSGYFGPVPASGITFDENVSNIEQLSKNLYRVQHIDWPELGVMLEGISIRPLIVYIDAEGSGALKVDRTIPGSGASKHQAYAMQWFCMAIVLAVIGLINYRRR
jgi:surfeit locus 1 family protein